MKKILLPFLCVMLGYQFSVAQFCGVRPCPECAPGNHQFVSTPDSAIGPFINGQMDTVNLYLQFTDTITFGSHYLLIDSFSYDTFYSSPFGLCWNIDRASKTYSNGDHGHIQFIGEPCIAPGQYEMDFVFTAYVPFGISNIGNYRIRILNPGEAVVPFDNSQATDSNYAPILYGPAASCHPLTVTNTDGKAGITVKVSPNPFYALTAIEVEGVNQPYNFELYDVEGRLCKKAENIQTEQFNLQGNSLSPGIYFYHIVMDGRVVSNGKLTKQ